MSQYSNVSEDELTTCTSCDAPIIQTAPGEYVCVDCGESPFTRLSPPALSTEVNGVAIKKFIKSSDLTTAEILITLESERETPVLVDVTERLRPAETDGGVEFATAEETDADTQPDSIISVSRRVEPDESARITYSVSSDVIDLENRPQEHDLAMATNISVAPLDDEATSTDERDITFVDSLLAPTNGHRPDHGHPLANNGEGVTKDVSETHENGSKPSAGPRKANANTSKGQILTSRSENSHQYTGKVMVAIPAYNESGTIATVVSEATQHADTVLVVDDGSDDDTAERAANAGATVIEHPTNRGYGAALNSIFAASLERSVDHLVVIDGDGQHDPADIPELVEKQQSSGAQIIVGSRFADSAATNVPLYRRFGLSVINVLANLGLGNIWPSSYVSDTQSGFRAYDQSAIELLADDDWIGRQMDASIDILFQAARQGFEIAEIGTEIDYDVDNASTHSTIWHGYQVILSVLSWLERERPLVSLGVPGMILLAFGLAGGYMSLTEYFQTGGFTLSVALVATLLVFLGMLSCLTASIIHSLQTLSPSGGSGNEKTY